MSRPARRPPSTPEAAWAAWAAWRWASRRDRTVWVGIFLVVLGLGLVLQRFIPGLSFTGLVLLALGICAAAAWLGWRWRWAIVPAVLLLSLALAELATGAGLLEGEGWTALALGTGLLLLWAIGYRAGRSTWALWPGALLALIGIGQLSAGSGPIRGLEGFWPLLLIGLGALLVLSAMRGAGPSWGRTSQAGPDERWPIEDRDKIP